jgi:hypothetical protein
LLYLLVTRPFIYLRQQLIQILLELLFFGFLFSLAVLVRLDNEENRIKVGWALIVILLINQIFMVLAALIYIVKIIKEMINTSKPIPLGMTVKGKASLVELSSKLDKENSKHMVSNSNGMQTISLNSRAINSRKHTAKFISANNTYLKEDSLNEENEKQLDSKSPRNSSRTLEQSGRRSLLEKNKGSEERKSVIKQKSKASVFEGLNPSRPTMNSNIEKKYSSTASFENFRKEYRERASKISKKSINYGDQEFIDNLIAEEHKKKLFHISDDALLETFQKNIANADIEEDKKIEIERDYPCKATIMISTLARHKKGTFSLDVGAQVMVLKVMKDVELAEISCQDGVGFIEALCLNFASEN